MLTGDPKTDQRELRDRGPASRQTGGLEVYRWTEKPEEEEEEEEEEETRTPTKYRNAYETLVSFLPRFVVSSSV